MRNLSPRIQGIWKPYREGSFYNCYWEDDAYGVLKSRTVDCNLDWHHAEAVTLLWRCDLELR